MLVGLVENIRFGFSSLNSPVGNGSGAMKTQGGLPPGGVRFGFRPRGSPPTSPAIGGGNGVPQYQSGLPDQALRFGFKPRGTANLANPAVYKTQSGLPPALLRFGFAPRGNAPHGHRAVGGGRGHKHPRDWKPERGFSRKYFDEMLAADKAALAALKASENRKRVEQQEALEQAAHAAQEALAVAGEQPDHEADFAKLTRALEAAVNATNFATSLKRAKDAYLAAQAIINAQADEEEEEAMMLLLLN